MTPAETIPPCPKCGGEMREFFGPGMKSPVLSCDNCHAVRQLGWRGDKPALFSPWISTKDRVPDSTRTVLVVHAGWGQGRGTAQWNGMDWENGNWHRDLPRDGILFWMDIPPLSENQERESIIPAPPLPVEHDGDEPAAVAEGKAEPFVVKHYTSDTLPSIKGNGFDGLFIGTDREEAQEFIDFVNAQLATIDSLRAERDALAERLGKAERDAGTSFVWEVHARTAADALGVDPTGEARYVIAGIVTAAENRVRRQKDAEIKRLEEALAARDAGEKMKG